jgi:hypothetical protein
MLNYENPKCRSRFYEDIYNPQLYLFYMSVKLINSLRKKIQNLKLTVTEMKTENNWNPETVRKRT